MNNYRKQRKSVMDDKSELVQDLLEVIASGGFLFASNRQGKIITNISVDDIEDVGYKLEEHGRELGAAFGELFGVDEANKLFSILMKGIASGMITTILDIEETPEPLTVAHAALIGYLAEVLVSPEEEDIHEATAVGLRTIIMDMLESLGAFDEDSYEYLDSGDDDDYDDEEEDEISPTNKHLH